MIRDTFDAMQAPERGRFGDDESAQAYRPRVNGASDLVDLSVALHAETDRAVLVSPNGDESRAAWLPKSWLEIERRQSRFAGRRKNGRSAELPCIVITLPEWRAREKSLI